MHVSIWRGQIHDYTDFIPIPVDLRAVPLTLPQVKIGHKSIPPIAHMRTHTHTHTHTQTNTCIHSHTHMHKQVHMHTHKYTHEHKHTDTHTNPKTLKTQAHTCTDECTCTHINTHKNTNRQIHTQIQKHTRLSHTKTQTQINTHIYTYKHTHTHPHTHTHTEACNANHSSATCIPTSSELTPKGHWEVTSVGEDEEIYPHYAERFSHTFPALVCVCMWSRLANNVSMNLFLMVVCTYTCTWADVCPCAQATATGQCPCKTGYECCTDIVCAVMEFVPCFHDRLGPLEGNWSNCNKKARNSYSYSTNSYSNQKSSWKYPRNSWNYSRNRLGIVHVPVVVCVYVSIIFAL